MDYSPLHIASLNSGSNGNCYYIGNAEEAVLIDAGISCRETEKRMLRMNLSIDKVKAVFVSHEHTDHIRGLQVLAKKYRIPVYITPGTYQNSKLAIPEELLLHFNGCQQITIGKLQVHTFPKIHDAADPHSFMVCQGELKIGIFTDLGDVCENLSHYFSQCHAAFLETNYDTDMLSNGSYPYYLKRRISGGKGHLSNLQALELFKTCRSSRLSHLLLAHLSRDNNHPDVVEKLFQTDAGLTKIVVASRNEESAVYTINGNFSEVSPAAAGTFPVAAQDLQVPCF
ncbi:MBL fold metallo-hydrolase [Pedobacter antarcticus]|uniref:MBL fold metallo-hydrolase n=1 Tax=Pedobacter antarcticus TaxID=34086 RepID=UPI00088F46DF|nr:MBL fold metallo-hydrolase [Pedobacter antarcticus]SDM05783.1 Phosphoribosyl 1,2-cyclic phosphodiesterase [Pedobacter antarcticus]